LPDDVIVVPDVPRTLSGKLLEVPVKRMLMGRRPEEVASRDSLMGAHAFDWFAEFAAMRE
jgi:acetoacetyl-CoA synthetase